MEAFILDSDAYDQSEIERLFQLSTGYDVEQIGMAKQRLLMQLQKHGAAANKGFSAEKQREIAFFLDTIATRLINQAIKTTKAAGTSNNNNNNTNNVSAVQQFGSHFLIDKPDLAAGRLAKFGEGRLGPDSNAIPPGFMNPIHVRSTVQAICIDSRFRPNYYGTKSSNFQVTLPAIQRKVVSMRVASIELPTTYYAVSLSQGNVTCLIIKNGVNGTLTTDCWVLTLPDGNYEQSFAGNSNAAFIEDAMVEAIARAQPAILDVVKGTVQLGGLQGLLSTVNDLSFTVNHASGKSVFGIPPDGVTNSTFLTNGFTVRFNVDQGGSLNNDIIVQLRLGWQLGFRAAQYACTEQGSVVSEGICLVVGPRYAFLSIDDYQKNTGPSYMVAYNSSILQDNLITRINLAELQADTGVYQSSSDPGLSTQLNRTREYFGPVDIQRLHIALYDEYGRVIDLNNMDWSLTLAFEQLYT